MTNTELAERAKATNGQGLQAKLEVAHPNAYVAIEPKSGEHFLGDSFGRAIPAARAAHPDRISFVIRIGHPAAIHLGGKSFASGLRAVGLRLRL